jgi:hypothetical protein
MTYTRTAFPSPTVGLENLKDTTTITVDIVAYTTIIVTAETVTVTLVEDTVRAIREAADSDKSNKRNCWQRC